ncbi:hypothetical protein B0G84_7575 [Paraburkholderia sp. BL8N3]|nr:hypothetical protein B0G84_7575 [Paraburkholderia sp. BL8N3]
MLDRFFRRLGYVPASTMRLIPDGAAQPAPLLDILPSLGLRPPPSAEREGIPAALRVNLRSRFGGFLLR